MGLVTTDKMFAKAADGGYAIGAFNFNNMEVVQAIVTAAANTNSPVILQASTSAIKYMGFEYINTVNNTVSWGSSEWESEVVSSGVFDFTDGAFIVARKHGAYDYVIESATNKMFTIEEYQDRFLMN